MKIDPSVIDETPVYVLDEASLRKNLEILADVQSRSGARIIVALKGFAFWHSFPLVSKYLYGASASSLNEAKLARETLGKEVHTYAPAYSKGEFDEILQLSDHITFNSFSQWKQFRKKIQESKKNVRVGIRVNPEYSEVGTDLYDPCAKYSRLGVTKSEFEFDELEGISGLHFHSHCGNDSQTLRRSVKVWEKSFGHVLQDMEWVNFGGGHHITRKNYDRDLLVDILGEFQEKYRLQVYLEPGEAVGWHTGALVASVLDVLKNEIEIAMLDTSAAAHMPDCIEMPYTPEVIGAGKPGEFPYQYRLGGMTCLAGDVIGDYSFPRQLKVGDKIVFNDMIHYTIVKNNTFNGVSLPSLAIWGEDNQFRVIKKFGYESYKERN